MREYILKRKREHEEDSRIIELYLIEMIDNSVILRAICNDDVQDLVQIFPSGKICGPFGAFFEDLKFRFVEMGNN